MQKGPSFAIGGVRRDMATFAARETLFARDEVGRTMRNTSRLGFALAVAVLFVEAVVPLQAQGAPLPKSKCVKAFCSSPKKQCVEAFKGQFRDAKATCGDLSGKARKLCKRDKRTTLKQDAVRCKAAFGICKACCKDPDTTGCGVAVFGDGICGGTTVTGEQCDGEDDSACPGECRADCTCPPPSTSTTTVVPPATTTSLSSTTTTVRATTTSLSAGTTSTTTSSTMVSTTNTAGSTTTTSATTASTSTTLPPCIEQIRDGNAIGAKESCAFEAAGDPSNFPANLLAALSGLLVDVLQTPTLTDVIPSFGVQRLGSAATVCGLSVAYLEEILPGALTTGAVVAAAREDAIPLVDNAMSYLDRIPEGATIRFDPENLPSCIRLSGIGQIEIDNGEFLALRAALNAVAAAAHVAAAYDGDFDLADAVNNTRSPKEVFLSNPGLFTLLPGVGKLELGLARSRLDAALGSFIGAIDFIDSEADNQLDDVLVIAPPDRDGVEMARATAARLRSALTGVATFEASVFPLLKNQRLSLAMLFDGDVANLRPFFPGFDDAGKPDVCEFPDPRLGGLAPDMTKAELSRLLCSVCGDGILGLDEECDGASDSACPGLCSATCRCRPLFDDCEHWATIPALPFTDTQDTASATSSPDDPVLSCGAGGRQANSVWYTFIAPSDGAVVADTSGSNYDTVLAAHTGTCGSLEETACDDDGGEGFTSVISFPVVEGMEYLLEVTSYGSGRGGPLTLNVSFSLCGDGVLDEGEECDPPGSVGDCPGSQACRSDCSCNEDFYCPPNTAGGPNLLAITAVDGGDLDIGWTGVGHNAGVPIGGGVYACLEGCDTSTNPSCFGTGGVGEGSINGTTLGPPLPLLAADVAICVINEFSEDITIRELNLQTGEVEMRVKLNSIAYLTGDKSHPCPTCSGGAIGQTGTCLGLTPRLGQSCTTQGKTVGFGNTSSDCLPFAADNAGELDIVLDPITSGTITMNAELPCSGGLCPCSGGGNPTKMNDCDNPASCSEQVCTDNGGSDDVKSGIQPGVDQQCCRSRGKTIPCFIGDIFRTGEAVPGEPAWPDPRYPKTAIGGKVAGVFCIPPTNSNTINQPTGLGGPGAFVLPNVIRVEFIQ